VPKFVAAFQAFARPKTVVIEPGKTFFSVRSEKSLERQKATIHHKKSTIFCLRKKMSRQTKIKKKKKVFEETRKKLLKCLIEKTKEQKKLTLSPSAKISGLANCAAT
jgi:hypothetical protein